MTTSPTSWPDVLLNIIKSTKERQRLASNLGVTATTLVRWANAEYSPQRSHLIHLVQYVQPHDRQEFIAALELQYPDIHNWLKEDSLTTDEISADFFAQVLNVRTTTTESLLFWRISDMVLKEALELLDPNRLGMAIKLIQCMPPSPEDGKIRSLRERAGKGTSPWTADLEHDVLFLGLESMSGYVVEVRHVVNDDDLRRSKTFPAYQAEFEISAAAHPIRLEGRLAGCLLASSTQVGYFSQQRLALLATFSDLMALAFNKREFYPPELVELRVMPRPEVQRPILATFRKRVTKKFQDASAQGLRLSNHEAEQLAWQEIESELLKLQVDLADTYIQL